MDSAGDEQREEVLAIMNYQDPILRAQLVNEYVLGGLRYGAAKRFERLLQDDPELVMMVENAQAELAPLVETLPPEVPDELVWSRIRQRLFTQTAIAAELGKVSPKQAASNDWQTKIYKTWAVAASIALVAVLWQPWSEQTQTVPQIVERPETPIIIAPAQDQQGLAAVLNSAESKQAAWLLTIQPANNRLIVTALTPQDLESGRAYELWVKLAQSDTVQSMGVVPASGKHIVVLGDELAKRIDQTEFFAISVEDPGGSPTGQPTTTPTHIGNLIEI